MVRNDFLYETLKNKLLKNKLFKKSFTNLSFALTTSTEE